MTRRRPHNKIYKSSKNKTFRKAGVLNKVNPTLRVRVEPLYSIYTKSPPGINTSRHKTRDYDNKRIEREFLLLKLNKLIKTIPKEENEEKKKEYLVLLSILANELSELY